jgi:hypothetical protein
MLDSAPPNHRSRKLSSTNPGFDSEEDVLHAWALDSTEPQATVVGDVVRPVRDAIANSIGPESLRLVCEDPDLVVPVSSGDLQLVMINLMLACHDTVGPGVPIEVHLRLQNLSDMSPRDILPSVTGESSSPIIGRHLVIHVASKSPANRLPVISAFSACERLVRSINGRLRASADRSRVTLTALIPVSSESTGSRLRA